METTSSKPRTRRPSLLRGTSALAGLLIALTLVGCSGGNADSMSAGSDDSGGEVSADMPAPAAEAPAEDGGAVAEGFSADSAGGDTSSGNKGVSVDLATQTRAVIATGTVSLNDDDVAAARSKVSVVTDTYRGQVAEEKTENNGKGELVAVRVVLRVPTTQFSAAMDDLEGISKVHSRTIGTEDVTTQVIDVDARVRAQTKSLARIEALLAEATTFRDVVAIESQLTSRQAELESLKAQQAWLADQTSMSTITVYIHELDDQAPAPEKADTGFVAGIKSGWHALGKATVGVATVLGAVLPFALVAGIVGYPLWLLVRRFGRPQHTQPVTVSGQDSVE